MPWQASPAAPYISGEGSSGAQCGAKVYGLTLGLSHGHYNTLNKCSILVCPPVSDKDKKYTETGTWGQFYQTFFVRNLLIFEIS